MAGTRYVRFNINDCVRVKLSDFGRGILYKQHAELVKFVFDRNPNAQPIPFEINEDEQGWSQWQLWALMAKFGPYISMVTPAPFASDIEFEVKDD